MTLRKFYSRIVLGFAAVYLFLAGAESLAAVKRDLTLQPESKVEFLAIGNPSLLKIRGEGAKALVFFPSA